MKSNSNLSKSHPPRHHEMNQAALLQSQMSGPSSLAVPTPIVSERQTTVTVKPNATEAMMREAMMQEKVIYKSGDVSVVDPWSEDKARDALVEKNVNYNDYNGLLKQMRAARTTGYGLLVTGPPGTGKTEAVKKLSEETGLPLYRLNLSEGADEGVLIGGREIIGKDSYYVLGYAPAAFQHGGILYLDELNEARPEILVRLHPFLERKAHQVPLPEAGGYIAKRNPNFFVVATINPKSRKAGSKDLADALKDRLTMTAKVSYPTPATELKIIEDDLPYKLKAEEEDQVKKIIQVANRIRDASNPSNSGQGGQSDIFQRAYIPSIRETEAFARLIHDSDLTPREAAYSVIVNKYSDSDPEAETASSSIVDSLIPAGPLQKAVGRASAAASASSASETTGTGTPQVIASWSRRTGVVKAPGSSGGATGSGGGPTPDVDTLINKAGVGTKKREILEYKKKNPNASIQEITKAMYPNEPKIAKKSGFVAHVLKGTA